MFDCNSKLKGAITINVFDKDGQLKDSRHVTNKIVLTGCNVIASLMTNQPLPIPSHIACGVGGKDTANAAMLNDEKLQSEVAIVQLDTPAVRQGNAVTFEATFGPNTPDMETAPLKEVGIWCLGHGGKFLLNRATFAVVNKTRDDTVVINWVVTVLSDDGVANPADVVNAD